MKLPLRFSLRTLAILVTLLCITIGAPIAYIRYHAQAQRQAIARLQALGVDLKAQDASQENPNWFTTQARAWIDPDAFRRTVGARTPKDLQDLDDVITQLQILDGLTALQCQSGRVTDDHLRQLAQISTLVELTLDERVEGYSVSGLRSLLTRNNWRDLHVPKADCNDDDLKEIAKQEQLYLIAITTSKASAEGLRELANLKSLREAVLHQATPLKAFTGALPTLSKLSSLMVFDSTLSSEDLASIGRLTSLKLLTLDNCRIEGPALTHFSSLALLTLLDLHNTEIAEEDMDRLSNFAALRMLGLHGGITDNNIDRLDKLAWLYVLEFSATELTDEGLMNYRFPSSLQVIVLPKNTKCTVQGFRRFQEKKPIRIVVRDDDGGVQYLPGGKSEKVTASRYE